MSITIQLPLETETALREKAKLQGATPEEFLTKLIQESMGSNDAKPAKQRGEQLTTEEWIAEWRAWVASHKPVHHFVDDSRESIYEGCGE